jgi:putative hydrolase of the HAD superfamily
MERAARPARPVIQVVFFDAGETILRPFPSFPELFSMTLEQNGIQVDPETVEPVLYSRVRDLAAVARDAGVSNASTSAEGSRRLWTFLYEGCLKDLGIKDLSLAGELYRVFSDSSSYRLFDDVLPTLRHLSNHGYRLGLISNFEGWLEELLIELKVGHLFDVTVISGVEGIEKPDPRIYELAVSRAGIEPSRGVHVGDAPIMDVEPAAEVGLHAILLDRFDRHPPQRCPTIRSLEELPAIVAKL